MAHHLAHHLAHCLTHHLAYHLAHHLAHGQATTARLPSRRRALKMFDLTLKAPS